MTVDSNTTPIALQPARSPYLMRAVQLQDTPALRKDCWSDFSEAKANDRLHRLLSTMKRERGLGMVVENAERTAIIGFGQIERLTKCIEISSLVISESYRRQGIGTALIQTLIQRFNVEPNTCIEIGVATDNLLAMRLYLRLGFKFDRQRMMSLSDTAPLKESVIYLRLPVSE